MEESVICGIDRDRIFTYHRRIHMKGKIEKSYYILDNMLDFSWTSSNGTCLHTIH